MPTISPADAGNVHDRTAVEGYYSRMRTYIIIHKQHFLKDAILSLSLMAFTNAQTHSLELTAASAIIPVLGIFAHTYHWGNAETKIRETQNYQEHAVEKENTFRRKIGKNRLYSAKLPKDKTSFN